MHTKKQIIVAIGREHGSGGHYIAQMISRALGVRLYDKKSIEAEVVDQGYSPEIISQMDERPVNFFTSRRIGKYSNSLEVNVAERTFQMLQAKAAQGESFVVLGRCGEQGPFKEIFPNVFDTLGSAYLQDTAACRVIVMDELGFMESEARAFRAAVLGVLDGEVPVLAAVKDRMDVPFLHQVCAHPRAEVVPIDTQNRDALFHRLLPIVKSWK